MRLTNTFNPITSIEEVRMEEKKVIELLRQYISGLNDVWGLVSKVDAGSIKYLLSMYKAGLELLADKIEQEGITHVDES
jgi:uncharacterized protein (DUF1015 family)